MREIQKQDKDRTKKIKFLLDFFDKVVIILERDWLGLPQDLLIVKIK